MYEDMTLLRVSDLESFIQNELNSITKDTDTLFVTARLMYKILQFSIENNNSNEHILHNECWKYWEIVKDTFMEQIP